MVLPLHVCDLCGYLGVMPIGFTRSGRSLNVEDPLVRDWGSQWSEGSFVKDTGC